MSVLHVSASVMSGGRNETGRVPERGVVERLPRQAHESHCDHCSPGRPYFNPHSSPSSKCQKATFFPSLDYLQSLRIHPYPIIYHLLPLIIHHGRPRRRHYQEPQWRVDDGMGCTQVLFRILLTIDAQSRRKTSLTPPTLFSRLYVIKPYSLVF